MPPASRLDRLLAYSAPILFGLRQWLAACRRDPANAEYDPIG